MKEDDGDWKEITTVKAYDNEYRIPDLKPERKYSFAVVAENKAGRGDAMETMTPTVLKEKPKKAGTIVVLKKYLFYKGVCALRGYFGPPMRSKNKKMLFKSFLLVFLEQ